MLEYLDMNDTDYTYSLDYETCNATVNKKGKRQMACFTEFAPLTNMHVQILNILKCVFFFLSSKLNVHIKYIIVN